MLFRKAKLPSLESRATFCTLFLLLPPLIFEVRYSIVITWNFVKLSFEENLSCRGSSTLMADSRYSYSVNAKHIEPQFSIIVRYSPFSIKHSPR